MPAYYVHVMFTSSLFYSIVSYPVIKNNNDIFLLLMYYGSLFLFYITFLCDSVN